jgi:hypothetical protein
LIVPIFGLPSGIHWHMNIANKITYYASDAQRQVIPWVQAEDMQGRVTVYKAKGSSLTAAQIDTAPKRRMDCIDCRDRPSHKFTAPDESVDDSLLAGRIDASLPFIKQQAVAVLTKTYNTNGEALDGIRGDIQKFYSAKYPDVYASRRQAVQTAIADLQHIYQSTIFPYMKVEWRTHPIGEGELHFGVHQTDRIPMMPVWFNLVMMTVSSPHFE